MENAPHLSAECVTDVAAATTAAPPGGNTVCQAEQTSRATKGWKCVCECAHPCHLSPEQEQEEAS